ncbi:hypothetical protein ACHAO1_009633 [Botrytis cinerea]
MQPAFKDTKGISSDTIDVLANIAGVIDSMASADKVTDDDWDRIIAINLTAPTKLIRAVLPFMRAKKNGVIINLCSKAALSGAAAGVAYTASKHGLVRDIPAKERVMTNMARSMNKETMDLEAAAVWGSVLALHMKPGEMPHVTVSEIAEAVLFLASDGARSINGVALPIDNAWSTI